MWKDTLFGYKINEDGEVLSPTGKKVSPYRSSDYYRLNLFEHSKFRNFCIHRLLAIAFVNNPAPTEFNIVDHVNRDTFDNRIVNLRWINTKLNALNTDAKGVFYNSRWKKYVARVCGKYVGCKKTFEEAHELYLSERQKVFDAEYKRCIAKSCTAEKFAISFSGESSRSPSLCVC